MDFTTLNRTAFSLVLTAAALSAVWVAGSVIVPFTPPARPAVAIPADPAVSGDAAGGAQDSTPPDSSSAGASAGAQTSAAAVPMPSENAAPTAGNATHGERLAQQNCAMCHTLTEGGPDTVGPNLYGVFGRKIGGKTGYGYSAALTGHSSESWDATWLDAWLRNPAAFAAGTRMSFPGLPEEHDRADIIAWLKTLRSPSAP